jgi:hypothetical protein
MKRTMLVVANILASCLTGALAVIFLSPRGVDGLILERIAYFLIFASIVLAINATIFFAGEE